MAPPPKQPPALPCLDPDPVGAAVRRARLRSGLSQTQAAEKMVRFCSVRYVSDVECGHRHPSLEWLHAFAVAVGVDPHELDPRLSGDQ